MNIALIAWNAAALLMYMTIVFAIAYKRKRLDTVDVAWGGAFVVAAAMVAGLEPQPSTILILLLVNTWAIRLSSHILDRVQKHKTDDPRYTEIAKKWDKQTYWQRAFFSVFLLQGFIALVVSLPTVFAAGEPLKVATPIMIVGTAVWLLGFMIEALADRQLSQFLINGQGKVLDRGLWRYSRHPNYLGEITQWYGIGIIACSSSYGWIGLIGPLVLNVLIRFVSGVPPIERRKANDPAYKQYMQHTWPILPKLFRS